MKLVVRITIIDYSGQLSIIQETTFTRTTFALRQVDAVASLAFEGTCCAHSKGHHQVEGVCVCYIYIYIYMYIHIHIRTYTEFIICVRYNIV